VKALIVDGYNVIHAWPALKSLLRAQGLEESRRRLIEELAAYTAQTAVHVTVVFDAGNRQRGQPTRDLIEGVTVRFGTRTATADHIIERMAYQASQRGEGVDLVVATDDRLQRDVVGAMGVATMSAKSLDAEVRRVADSTERHTQHLRDQGRGAQRLEHRIDPDVARRLEALRRGSAGGEEPAAD
jgi:predicted RNA-binding protein with PIN domain